MQIAYWIKNTHLFDPDDYECSACGASFPRPYAVCPHCGRTMRKTKNDPLWIDELEELDMIFEDD